MKKQSNPKKTNKPVHTVRIGWVSASVFLNNAKDGTQFPSTTIRRTYKTEEGLKDTSSFGVKHLSELAAVIGDVRAWIYANYPDAAK